LSALFESIQLNLNLYYIILWTCLHLQVYILPFVIKCGHPLGYHHFLLVSLSNLMKSKQLGLPQWKNMTSFSGFLNVCSSLFYHLVLFCLLSAHCTLLKGLWEKEIIIKVKYKLNLKCHCVILLIDANILWMCCIKICTELISTVLIKLKRHLSVILVLQNPVTRLAKKGLVFVVDYSIVNISSKVSDEHCRFLLIGDENNYDLL